MATDAHDDPYNAQHRPFVLACSECGEVGRIYGLLPGESWKYPDKPLCRECTDMYVRVWGEGVLSGFSPPSTDLEIIEDYETGELHEYRVVLCPRCNGSGWYMGGQCFKCIGARYTLQSDKGVRRTARWWQTYHQNRTEEGSHAKADTKPSS